MDFRDRHVVVTGGAGALGSAIVNGLIAAGAVCHLPVRSEDEAKRLPDHARVKTYLNVDLTDESAVESLFRSVAKPWASINVAGGFAGAAFAETSKHDFLHQIDMNLMTCFLACRGAVRAMIEAKSGGRIVNVAARPALEPRTGAGMVAYTASKSAVAALTAALAEEVAKNDILVNAVAPSIMDTPANRQAMPKANHANWPKVEEVASTILFLASPDNKVTRGAIVPVYGRS
jgi:NAD(P)-dependent dehydrogenase (short-subunit alcohol dehydrogenase family)